MNIKLVKTSKSTNGGKDMKESTRLAIQIMVHERISFDWEILSMIETEIERSISK